VVVGGVGVVVGVCDGVGSVPVGVDPCVGGTSEGVGAADDEELLGVGVGVLTDVLVGAAAGQVGTLALV
jgi:hypothetical protein